MNHLDDELEKVVDLQSFLIFVEALRQDKLHEDATEQDVSNRPFASGDGGWEHTTIVTYLEACIAWTEDSFGQEHELPEEPSWKSFARFLYAGKFYE